MLNNENGDSILFKALQRDPEALQAITLPYILAKKISPDKLQQNVQAVAAMQQGMLSQINSAQALGNSAQTNSTEETPLFEFDGDDERLTPESWGFKS